MGFILWILIRRGESSTKIERMKIFSFQVNGQNKKFLPWNAWKVSSWAEHFLAVCRGRNTFASLPLKAFSSRNIFLGFGKNSVLKSSFSNLSFCNFSLSNCNGQISGLRFSCATHIFWILNFHVVISLRFYFHICFPLCLSRLNSKSGVNQVGSWQKMGVTKLHTAFGLLKFDDGKIWGRLNSEATKFGGNKIWQHRNSVLTELGGGGQKIWWQENLVGKKK